MAGHHEFLESTFSERFIKAKALAGLARREVLFGVWMVSRTSTCRKNAYFCLNLRKKE
jgi:hypothetical protein